MSGQKKSGCNKNSIKGLWFENGENIVQKLLNFFRNMNKEAYLIIVIIGVVLMLMASGGKDDKKANISSDEQTALTEILRKIEGVGNVYVMITYEPTDKKNNNSSAKGVIIAADGADDINVKTELSEAAGAALNLPAHKVKVFKCKGNK